MPLTPVLEADERRSTTLAWPRTPYPFNVDDTLTTESLPHSKLEVLGVQDEDLDSDSGSDSDSSPEALALSETEPLLPYETVEDMSAWLTTVPGWGTNNENHAAMEDWVNADEITFEDDSSCGCSDCSTIPCQASEKPGALPPANISKVIRKAEDIDNLRAKRIKPSEPLHIETTVVITPQSSPLNSKMVPTPVSPERGFHKIIAERATPEGVMYKVSWVDSWVHACNLPNIDSMRAYQLAQTGMLWNVVE